MPNTKTDLDNPLAWWCVEEGLGSAAISRFFPRLEISLPDETAVRRTISPQPVRLPGIRGVRPAMTLEPGDLLAIEYAPRVFTGLVLGSHAQGKKRLPIIEIFSRTYDEIPDVPSVLSGPPRMGVRLVLATDGAESLWRWTDSSCSARSGRASYFDLPRAAAYQLGHRQRSSRPATV